MRPWSLFLLLAAPLVAAEPYYRIQARLSGSTISGQAEIVYCNRTGRPLTRIPVEFPAGAGFDRFGPWKLVHDGDGIAIELTAPLAPGGEVRLNGEFHGKLRSQNGYQFANDWYPHVVAFVDDKFDREESEASRFEIVLDAPAREVVAASAKVETEEPLPGGYRRLKYRSEPVSSFGIATSPEFRVVARDAGGVAVREYQLPRYQEWNRKNFADTAQQVIDFYRDRFGEYPHESLAILPGPADSAGGWHLAGNMSEIFRDFTPRHVSPGFERYIVAHEIGHMLWGYETVMDSAHYNHWLGLGLGVYSDRLFMEAKTNIGGSFERRLVDAYLGVGVSHQRNTSLLQSWAELRKAPFDGNETVSHGKGFAVIQMLEQVVGPERFLELTRRVQRQHRWSHITAAEFIREAEAAAGQPLDWFLGDWVENDHVLSAEVESVEESKDGTVEIAVRQTGTARMPMVCEIAREDGSRTLLTVAREPERQVLRAPGAGPVRLVRLDPDRRLALFDPHGKSYSGRPWIVARRAGPEVLARNEAGHEHLLRLRIGEGKSRRDERQTIAAGQEISIAVPAGGIPLAAWDLTDNVRVSIGPQ
jgi:hypothetical protein